MDTDIWKAIPGFEQYEISVKGEVRKKGKTIRTTLSGRDRKKYVSVQLWKNCKPFKRVVHKLMYETYVEKVPTGYQVDHIDRDNMNNCLSNLRLVSIYTNQFNKGSVISPECYDYWQHKKRQEEDCFWGIALHG